MKTRLARIACLSIVAALPIAAHASPVDTGFGTVTSISTGWTPSNVIRVTTSAPFANPDSCPGTDGYMTEDGDSSNPAHHAAILAAFLSGKQVDFIVSGCTSLNRPRIISVIVNN